LTSCISEKDAAIADKPVQVRRSHVATAEAAQSEPGHLVNLYQQYVRSLASFFHFHLRFW
jgi:hypothetical protein